MTAPTTPRLPRRRVGRMTPPLVAAGLVTMPAVLAAVSGHLSLTGLVAVFLVALSVALLAATILLRLLHHVDGPAAARPTPMADPAVQAVGAPIGGTPLGRVPVARIPADQAIDGSAPRRAAAEPVLAADVHAAAG